MGLIGDFLTMTFGTQKNVLRETVEVFRENAEAGASRAYELRAAALSQFGAEFRTGRKGRFDRFMDGVNRLPRPMLALGTIGLMVAALADPLWFAARMQGIALVPEPLWWLLGVIVSFYFGARHQVKAQEFQEGIAASIARLPEAAGNIAALDAMRAARPGPAGTGTDAAARLDATAPDANPALEEWKRLRS
ncbi:holin family protein [Cribrihabitans neustonicus]|uniref:holin family protein n=1 Tax=Cribrihabitans neustonicus TaxID=1429085 RepID=UPI003B5C362A